MPIICISFIYQETSFKGAYGQTKHDVLGTMYKFTIGMIYRNIIIICANQIQSTHDYVYIRKYAA